MSGGIGGGGGGEGFDLSVKGQVHGFDTAQAAVNVGANDTIIYADSAQAAGIGYGASAKSTLATTGDLLAASAANTLSAITASATSGHVLTSTGAASLPTYQAVSGVSLSDDNTWTGTQTFDTNIEPSGGIAIKPIITRTFDYLALDDTVDPLVLSNVVGTNTDDGVITGISNGRQVSTGTASGNAGSLHPVPKNYDPTSIVIYGMAKRNTTTCNIWLGSFSQEDQGGDMVAYLDGTQATYKSMVIRQNTWGQLIAATDVPIDTNWTSFKFISDGTVQTMYLLVAGVWTAKATNSVAGYAPNDPSYAAFYINNHATTNIATGQFSRIRIEALT